MPDYEIRIRFISPEISRAYGDLLIDRVLRLFQRWKWFTDPTRRQTLFSVRLVRLHQTAQITIGRYNEPQASETRKRRAAV